MARRTILFASNIDDPAPWKAFFARERPDIEFRIWPDMGNPQDITHALIWRIPNGVLASLKNLKAIFSLGAGIDQIIVDPEFPKDIPLFRLVDAGLREQMTEYALYGVLHWHRRMGDYARQQGAAEWRMHPAVHPSQRLVGVMGLGVFGTDIARKLASMGFRVSGWSRTRKIIHGVDSFVGEKEFRTFLGQSEILINVLPLTSDTRGILSSELFAHLPGGGALVHLGRGGHLVESDLVAALDEGQLDWAMLDVFPNEPLPRDSPLWAHPKAFVTPHVAAQPVSDAAERLMLENFNKFDRGEEPTGRVDLRVGY
ncbi:MAG: glyoxylate/hydroxypyruvate reductase A [Mesorhizobium sp.]|uniref:2-hydroxyacid dehydrogenase n=1 Tax=unclassified Mesorhizobium TaxID=325217 RepID=UPI000F75EEE1|nr:MULTISPECIES: glyoxylate/hydroxypyruvate reductase A [unclassified Mesorhizobium]RVC82754.1 glyoxylate/hydroxypyruvate reductase A [Mesorhizobium sp. M2A.F.Ca.ET.046.02.1.1]AZO34769.1 glyoxylate/hydroxypyruvate reductase A [Mesorhizobium sp. M2A.F.Ca.ET.046.03.2.1]RWE21671.1 MAG: glyoxylate/hydroxypyruvate reductase A [Mesorhizobium sp.]RWF06278.1 MAG: glyoxylate/hydroxypyruvate reductase A [Mesorhizobium sp.]TIU75065.1 MAG: glyoxylate/hydroxypyruvate reductase A [Mesorhizobium sp.]